MGSMAGLSDSPRPLTPARAALADAIKAFESARGDLEAAARPVEALDRIRTIGLQRETAELRIEISRLHELYNTQFRDWIEAGGLGERPMPQPEMIRVEQRLSEIAGPAGNAEKEFPAASLDYTEAAKRLAEARARLRQTLWPTVVEAAEPVFLEMEEMVGGISKRHAQLHGLISVIRDLGNRDQPTVSVAFAAAEKIEERLSVTLRLTPPAPDPAPARSLIERLQSNAEAELILQSPEGLTDTR